MNKKIIVKVIRYRYDSYHIVDKIYFNDKLQFEQSNITNKNRYGSKKYKCNNGNIIEVNYWERKLENKFNYDK